MGLAGERGGSGTAMSAKDHFATESESEREGEKRKRERERGRAVGSLWSDWPLRLFQSRRCLGSVAYVEQLRPHAMAHRSSTATTAGTARGWNMKRFPQP